MIILIIINKILIMIDPTNVVEEYHSSSQYVRLSLLHQTSLEEQNFDMDGLVGRIHLVTLAYFVNIFPCSWIQIWCMFYLWIILLILSSNMS